MTYSLRGGHTTDISFLRNRVGFFRSLKTLWKSTMFVQSPSTLPTVVGVCEQKWLCPLLQNQSKEQSL